MHADDVERVVIPELVLEPDRQGRSGTGDDTEDQRADRRQCATGRGDGDQTGDDTRGGTEAGALPVADLLDQQPADHGSGGGGGGVHPDQAGLAAEVGGEGCAVGVELALLAAATGGGARAARADIAPQPPETTQTAADQRTTQDEPLRRLL